MIVIEAKDVEKSFNGRKILKGVTFRVKRGEIFGYLGPNGAGKTTTVRILTGIIKPDRGEVYVNGYDVVREPIKARKSVGVLPEVSNVYLDLTAWQNMMLASRLYGLDKKTAEKMSKHLLKDFGLWDKRDCKVKTFSKGMMQRLMFCMTLVCDPDVVFLDEPTSGLDVASARMLRAKVLEIAREGVTVLLTSHNMDEVDMLRDRVAIIKDGKIIADDSPDGIKRRVGGSVAVEVKFDKDVEFEGERVGDRYVVYTTDLHETICKIVEFAKRRKVKIISLNTRTPTLEDAFLKILGVKT